MLNKKFTDEIISTNYQLSPLQGGTLGQVYLVSGIAEAVNKEKIPYRIVLKLQNKWERYSDSESWRREFDLYTSSFRSTFSDGFRLPICYYAIMNSTEDKYELWLEYIEGISGIDLTAEMCEKASLELGRYQGRMYTEKKNELSTLKNLSSKGLMKNTYLHYRSWPLVYCYIRSDDCEFPLHVQKMLIDLDEHADEIIDRIEALPLVLCHRDFWINNLFYTNGKFVVIDWDTAGWGYLGEDIASLIADETDINQMFELYQRCIPAYYNGFSEYTKGFSVDDHCVHELILLMFGYRLVEWYLHTENDEEKLKHVQTLLKLYEMKSLTELR